MSVATIRPMLGADVDVATEMVLAGGWGDRRTFFRFAVDFDRCDPVVATDGDRIVGTGVATANGEVGWIGTIFVAPERRGAGIGTALTRAVMDALAARGCRSLVLVASAEGRPIYERLGFEIRTTYTLLDAPGEMSAGEKAVTGEAAVIDPRLRPFKTADLHAMCALDRWATAEDRSALLGRLAAPATAEVALRPDRSVGGFSVRAPWGGWATVAYQPEDGLRLLAWRRATAASDRTIVTGVPAENEAGEHALVAAGWSVGYHPVRMVRGPDPEWRPDALWGQFGMAVG